MPKRTSVRIIDNRRTNRATTISGVTLSAPAPGVSDHGLLLGLGDDDHPHYLLANGGRALAGNLAVANGVTVDGVDISAHAGDPAAHHAPVTAGTLISLSGQQVSVANGAAYQFIGTGGDTVPEWRTVSEFAGNGLAATNGVLAVGVAGLGLSVAADAVTLASSSNPGAAASVLATDASGYLSLVRLRTPLIDTISGNLTLQPASNIVVLPSAVTIQSSNYASQVTGWRATYAGEGDFRYLFTDELHAKSFITDLEQALAGGQIISKSVAVLASAFTAPAAGAAATLVVRDLPSAVNMACFVSGDIVRLRQFSRAAGSLSIADCWGVVTAYVDNADGTQTWTFTRSSAPNAGAMTAGTVIAPDAIVLDYGTTGNGFYEVNAVDGAYGLNSPYARIVSWTTHPATGQALRVQMGNLRGVYGYASTIYGVGMGDPTGANVTVEATNGVRLRQGTTDMIVLDPAGNSYFAGVMTIGTSGEIRQGTGTLGSTFTGLRLWRDSSIGRIGGYNANTLQWYGDTSGNFVAGAGYVLLNASGIRQTVANVKSAVTEPGAAPVTPAINQRLSFYDSADSADWGYNYPGGTNYDYFYPGMEWLRIYVSSQHFVQPQPYTTTVTDNYHVYDAVIEMPDNTFTTNAGIIQRRRLMLKAPAIELDSSSVTVQNAPVAVTTGATFTGQLVRDVTTSAYSAGFLVRTTGALATATNDDYLTIFHLADNEMAIGVADASAWRTLVLQPYGGTVDVRGRILAAAVGYAWSELTPQNGWSNYGTPNATFGVKRFGDQISVKGLVRATTTIASNTALNVQLAAEYRPAAGRSFACMASIGGAKAIVRVYVDSSGYIRPQDGFNSNDWLSVEFTYFTGG